jgi:hypothetical protein
MTCARICDAIGVTADVRRRWGPDGWVANDPMSDIGQHLML